MPVIYILSGSDIGKTFEVDAGATFGRSPDSDVVLRDTSASRKHALLERRAKAWFLVDQGSRNGISQEGTRLKEFELTDGALFEIGALELRFRLELQGTKVVAPPKPATTKPSAPPEPEIRFDSDTFAGDDDEDEDYDDEDEADDDESSDDFAEIELEDEELLETSHVARSTVVPTSPSSSNNPSQPGAPLSAPRVHAHSPPAQRSAPPAASAAVRGVDIREAGRPALKFSPTQEDRGFFQADLGQYPLWVRLLAGLFVAALFVGIFYFAFRTSGALKQRVVDTQGVEDVEEDL